MADRLIGPQTVEPLPLPVHIPTITRHLLRHWPLLIVIVGISAVLGIVAALQLATRTYQSELILQYQPLAACEANLCEEVPPTLDTLLHRVKTQAALSQVREDLQWETTLQELGSSITVFSDGGTELLIIRGEADSPEKALALVEAVQGQFLATRQQELRQAQLREVQRQLEDARRQRLSVDAQLQTMNEQINAYRQMADRERQDMTNNNPTVAILQRELLIENLEKDREIRLAEIELERAQRAYRRAQQLVDQQALPAIELEEAGDAYRQAQIAADDIRDQPETEEQLKRLERAALSGRNTLTPSDHLLLAVLHRAIAVELEAVEISELEARLSLQRQSMRADERSSKSSLETTGFKVISPALLQPRPASSNRRLIASFVAILTATVGFGLIALRLLLYRRIRSGSEWDYHYDLPLLAILPDSPKSPLAVEVPLAYRLLQRIDQTSLKPLYFAPTDDGFKWPISLDDIQLAWSAQGRQVQVHDLVQQQIDDQTLPGSAPAAGDSESSLTLIKAPPILGNPSLDRMASALQGVILVVSSKSTTRAQIDGARERLQLAQVNCLGAVLCEVHPFYLKPQDRLVNH